MDFVVLNNLFFYNSINNIMNSFNNNSFFFNTNNKFSLVSLILLNRNINIIYFLKNFYKNSNRYSFNNKFPLALKLSNKKYTYKSYNSNNLIITDLYTILPYTKKDLKFYLSSYPEDYSSLDDVIYKEFTRPYKLSYSNSYINRFKEIFNLLHNKELMDFFTSFRLAFPLMKNSKINPIIISACKSKKELDNYLSYIDNSSSSPTLTLPFNVIFKVSPTQ